MNKKEKQLEKSKKIRNIVKWAAVGLGWSALAFCFFGLLTLGIKGCVNKQNQQNNVTTPMKMRAVNNTYDHIYYYNGNTYDQLNYTSNHYNLDFVGFGDLHGNVNYFNKLDFTLSQGSSINVLFYLDDTIQFQYTASYNTGGKYNLPDESYWGLLYLKLETVIDVNDDSLPSMVTSFFIQVFNEDLGYHFVFNETINKFAPLGSNDDYFYIGDRHGSYTIFKGLFSDELGNYYNRITCYYTYGTGRYGTPSDNRDNDNNNTTKFLNMNYYSLDGKVVTVNHQDYGISTASGSVGQTVMLRSSSWLSSTYRNIVIHYVTDNTGYDDSSLADLSRITALTTFNNNTQYSGALGGSDIGGNPLELIGRAFGGLSSIFSISIIPGITFGVLLFLPLTAGIVLAIVKVVRK